MRRLSPRSLTILALALVATSAVALVTPKRGHREAELESFAGPAPRGVRQVSGRIPARAQAAMRAFVHAAGPGWRSMWDATTDVPLRLYGPGLPAAGASASAAKAEAFARTLLGQHLDLLSPGAAASDFVLVANQVDDGQRTVGFRQTYRGLEVVGGQLSFRFRADRLSVIASEALPDVAATVPTVLADHALVKQRALAWIASDRATGATVGDDVRGPIILPLVTGEDGKAKLSYHAVLEVRVAARPIGDWSVYVDAATAEPVARRQRLRFADGAVRYGTPVRWPGGAHQDFVAEHANLTVDGTGTTAGADGQVSWAGTAAATVLTQVVGQFVQVVNSAGTLASQSLPLPVGGTVVWSDATEAVDAQLTAYIHANRVKDYARTLNPALTWLDGQIVATVNIADVCNAFSDGESINFYQSDATCTNTGEMPDVIYHEFGHSLHNNSIIQGAGAFEGALSEGIGDVLSTAMTGDHGLGRGFFKNETPLRDLDPVGVEKRWPEDISGDPHETGLIFGGAMWDLRKALIIALGNDTDGIALTMRLFYAAVQRASDIPSSYVEVLAADDDDGDLTNGTPHQCAIDAAFGPHGLASEVGAGSIAPPVAHGLDLFIAVVQPTNPCVTRKLDGGSVRWRKRGATAETTLAMTLAADGLHASLPDPGDGSDLEYQIDRHFDDATTDTLPTNPADPWFVAATAQATPIYCTDFEHDPAADGWTHGLSAGQAGEGADDWTWGAPAGTSGSFDPTAAYSGTQVFGNDLGGPNFNGTYQNQKTNFALSPTIDTHGYPEVHLQFQRWLNVQDGSHDQATIYGNDAAVWSNAKGDGTLDHTDREWRFQDLDVSTAAKAGTLAVKFELASDAQGEYGGWTLDDFCVVAIGAGACGDGVVGGREACDDGAANSDTAANACRTTCVAPTCGDGVVDDGETCDDGNTTDGDGCPSTCNVASTGGCGCHASGSPGDLGLVALVGLALVGRRRRRRPFQPPRQA